MVSDSESSDSDVPISSTGVRRGQVAPESSDSDSKVPVSSTGVKRGQAAPDSGAPSGKRRKKISRSPYVGKGKGKVLGRSPNSSVSVIPTCPKAQHATSYYTHQNSCNSGTVNSRET